MSEICIHTMVGAASRSYVQDNEVITPLSQIRALSLTYGAH